MEAGDTDLNDTCLKDAKRKQLGVRASAQKKIEQIDNALDLADEMTARIDAVSAVANDALKNCFVYNSESAQYYREKRQSRILRAWIVTDPEYIRLVDADIEKELSKRRAKK